MAEFVGSHSASFFNSSGNMGVAFEKAVAQGIVRAGMAKLQGQKVSAGFCPHFVAGFSRFASARSGFVLGLCPAGLSSLRSSDVASGFSAPKSWGIKEGTFVNAVVGGTTSELTGGKFANGAVTGAFVHLFNDWGKFRAAMKKMPEMLWEFAKVVPKTFSYFWTKLAPRTMMNTDIPWYAKAPLYHASGVIGYGGYEAGVLTTSVVLTHPVETTQFVKGLTSGNPAVSTATSIPETTGFFVGQGIRRMLQ